MRRGSFFVFAIAALGLAASPAAADGSFDLFKRMCLDTDGDATLALAAAEAAGWGEIPTERLRELATAIQAVGARGRLAATPNGIFVLMTGQSPESDSEIATDVCDVFGFRQTQVWDAAPEIEQWVGLPPERVEGPLRMWTYEIRDGRKVAPAADAPLTAGYAILASSQPTNFRYELARNRPAN
ncbi:hypothetical protein GGQ87_000729 [Brevundimonas alba]|uniref:Uncharacterized protein n=1 Tax=Brevundimonas alba TaxID=74314 RepID=A0A7X5YJQ2_9CAUL|nr:hypothetical protein [Brevundimonas alba]NJC40471.1 hypothetical protein [Brevundimonas alba]